MKTYGPKEVTKSVENPITGKSELRTANFSLSEAENYEDVLAITGGDVDKIVGWFNVGRRITARTNASNSLMGIQDSTTKALLKAFRNGIVALADDPEDSAQRKTASDFLLAKKKYAPLQGVIDNWGKSVSSIDFDAEELPLPRSFRAGQEEEGEEAEAETAGV